MIMVVEFRKDDEPLPDRIAGTDMTEILDEFVTQLGYTWEVVKNADTITVGRE